ncbi:RNA polymerase sigma-70 factor [Chitinophaga sp. GCM10012297]|uniref:RNA polymerase sigma-70 factor n=1 Tax=Chitinophaga chungangae TaxID=2821488 RepID=A0ABS3YFR9_9BACT|nr:RNA polymerase sigma-70 factor [Chitinophaga chungangae]MBO9153525.1 RNA polymerase sigma-70 factor [Chitinophaga chungangae]
METKSTGPSRPRTILQHEDGVTFDQVYAKYWKPLLQTAFRILKDEQAAEDIVQDTFIKLWEHWNMPHTNIKGWLFTTSYHLVLKKLKQLQSVERIGLANFSEPLAGEADELIQASQLQFAVEACVDDLPKQCRRVYTMSRHEKLSIKHIALELGISQKTVEYHISTALRRIRQRISGAILILLYLFL